MHSLLIANRGEIACRIIRTARRCGLRSIAVYSDVDAHAQHVLQADTAVCIGEAPAATSYLDIGRIMKAARKTGADAIHPGYGFLSENPALVDACEAAGIVFVGPDSVAMRSMGLKDAAKRLMHQAGVPVVPGYHGQSQETDLLADEAVKIGYPVLIKARAGGGGKGMRRVDKAEDFAAALAAAQREATASFGDAHVLIEKYVSAPRHVEVQVFGDSHGNVVHLFERDCSLQRRHQKVIEEAPAPGMSDAVRQAMTEAAVRAARAINYRGAGTVEFIVDGSEGLRSDAFWFMEMNTRLQVEHPVTEAITGVDLVEWQLKIAAGERLPLSQDELHIRGHAVEARLYAENPAAGFLPAVGTLHRFRPAELGRVDSGVIEGDQVLPFYDPLLAKLISHADDRRGAFRQLAQQLATTVVLGTITNREFLWRLVSHKQVQNGCFDTSFIDAELTSLVAQESHSLLAVAAVELAAPWIGVLHERDGVAQRLGSWQLWGEASRQVSVQDTDGTHVFLLQSLSASGAERRAWQVSCPALAGFPEGGVRVQPLDERRVCVDGCSLPVDGYRHEGQLSLQLGPLYGEFRRPLPGSSASAGPVADVIVSPMPGRVISVSCAAGDTVRAGQALIVVEAMKMEQELSCDRDGVIESIAVRSDDQIAQGQELLRLVPEGE